MSLWTKNCREFGMRIPGRRHPSQSWSTGRTWDLSVAFTTSPFYPCTRLHSILREHLTKEALTENKYIFTSGEAICTRRTIRKEKFYSILDRMGETVFTNRWNTEVILESIGMPIVYIRISEPSMQPSTDIDIPHIPLIFPKQRTRGQLICWILDIFFLFIRSAAVYARRRGYMCVLICARVTERT